MTREEIIKTVTQHHKTAIEYVEKQHSAVVMTVLVGSQNYNIDHENSDIDTYSFILPSITSIAANEDPISTTLDLKDGHCNIKDIRVALNLLMKTNPNSIEWFCSDYIVYNPAYESLLKKYLSKENRKDFLYCDIIAMGKSCKGMANNLKNRNMPAGKKYSHALRVKDMWESYILGETDNILKFRKEETRELALKAKLDGMNDEEYQRLSEEISNEINESIEQIKKLDEINYNEQIRNKNHISALQCILVAKNFLYQMADLYF